MGAVESRIPNGCAHSLSTLKSEWPSVIYKSTKEQAEFADAVCRHESQNESFNVEQLKSIRDTFPMSPPDNTTGVGNSAYMALNAPLMFKTEWDAIHTAYMAVLQRTYTNHNSPN